MEHSGFFFGDTIKLVYVVDISNYSSMRVSLVKYTEVKDYKVDRPLCWSWGSVRNGWSCKWSGDATRIRWKMPKLNLTEEEEDAMRDEIYAEFEAEESSQIEWKVLEWRIEKRLVKYTL